MPIRKVITGNRAAEIAPLLEESGLFHAVALNGAGDTVSCRGADGKLRFVLKTSAYEGSALADCTFYVSENSSFRNNLSTATQHALAVNCVYLCSSGVILDCEKGAVLLTKNNLGELLYVVSDWTAATKAAALCSLRVYSWGDYVRNSYPVNLQTAYNQRDGAVVFVPFVSAPADDAQPVYASHAYFTPVYQYAESGRLSAEERQYLAYAGCWAIEDI